jgi:hypothetical protein
MVEHLKVMAALTVEPAYASLAVEPMAALLVERATHPAGPRPLNYLLVSGRL